VEYQDTIFDLLNGKEVTLKSDVLSSFANAVKFFDIRLEFTTKDANDQQLLDSVLKNMNIKLTHMGHSQYKCGEKFFMISHQQQIIEFSFEKGANGEPLRSNNVFKKIRSGDILLSPYTLWKVHLVDKYKRNLDFSRLFGTTKLSLTGQAQFIKLSNSICKQKSLESFYKLDEIATINSQRTN
jgi:hypothetical protein